MTRKSQTRTVRTRIRIEKHEVKLIRFGGKPTKAYCSRCGKLVIAVTARQFSAADLAKKIEADTLHFVCATSERPLICGKSLGW